MQVKHPQLDGVKVNQDGTLPYPILQAIKKAYEYIGLLSNVPTGSTVIQDLAANRLILHPAINEQIDTLYVETDGTGLIYIVRVVNGANTWVELETVFGRSNLTHANRLTKVSSSGVISESSITETGGKVGAGAAAGPLYSLDWRTAAALAGQWHLTDHDADDGSYFMGFNGVGLFLCHGALYDGANWKAKEATATIIQARAGVGGVLVFADTGLTPGNSYSPTQVASLDIAGFWDVLTSYKVAGTKVVGARGAALTATGSAVGAAPAAYSQAFEQTLATLANNLKTRVDELQSRLQAHGLIT